MRIAYVCADPGIPVHGTKGASVHIQDVVRELVRRGHDVGIHAVRLGEHPPADLAGVPTWAHPLPAHCADREKAQAEAAGAIAERLGEAGARAGTRRGDQSESPSAPASPAMPSSESSGDREGSGRTGDDG